MEYTVVLHRDPQSQWTQWEKGPWTDEPDLVAWLATETLPASCCGPDADRIECMIMRNRLFGTLCGYVRVPPSAAHLHDTVHRIAGSMNVHGGVTFEETDTPPPYGSHLLWDEVRRTEHLLGRADEALWIGFDCNHHMDLAPSDGAPYRIGGRSYRTLEYAYVETNNLAHQIALVLAGHDLHDRHEH